MSPTIRPSRELVEKNAAVPVATFDPTKIPTRGPAGPTKDRPVVLAERPAEGGGTWIFVPDRALDTLVRTEKGNVAIGSAMGNLSVQLHGRTVQCTASLFVKA